MKMKTDVGNCSLFWLPVRDIGPHFVAAQELRAEPFELKGHAQYIADHFKKQTASVQISNSVYQTDIYVPTDVDDYAYVVLDSDGKPRLLPEIHLDAGTEVVRYLSGLRSTYGYSESVQPTDKANLWTECLHRTLVIKSESDSLEMIDWRDVQNFSKLLLVGAPGVGKTTFLRRLAIEIADDGDTEAFRENVLPVYIQFREWHETESIQRLVNRQLADCHRLTLKGGLERLANSGRLLILIDGVDEVGSELRGAALHDIKEFTGAYPNARFIVAARPGSYLSPLTEDFRSCELTPLTKNQIVELCWHRLQGDDLSCKAFVKRLEAENDLLELAQNPLLLSMWLGRHVTSALSPHFVTDAMTALTDTLIRDWDNVRGIRRRRHGIVSPSMKYGLLRLIAGYLHEKGRCEFTTDEFTNLIGEIEIFPSTEKLLLELHEDTGLILPVLGGKWSFLHISVLEYFSAMYLVDKTTGTKLEDDLPLSHSIWRYIGSLASDLSMLLFPLLSRKPNVPGAIDLLKIFSQNLLVERSTISGVGVYVSGALKDALAGFELLSWDEHSATGGKCWVWRIMEVGNSGEAKARRALELVNAIRNGRDGVAADEIKRRARGIGIEGIYELVAAAQAEGEFQGSIGHSDKDTTIRFEFRSEQKFDRR